MECPFREKNGDHFSFCFAFGTPRPILSSSYGIVRGLTNDLFGDETQNWRVLFIKKNSNQLNYDFIKRLFFIKWGEKPLLQMLFYLTIFYHTHVGIFYYYYYYHYYLKKKGVL